MECTNIHIRKPQLLVSVRSADEALAALEGGAALIDVKEPANGALGRADDDVIHAVVRAVAGRRPVSAALGEWADGTATCPVGGLTYVKWGSAGCQDRPEWRHDMARLLVGQKQPRPVLVAYADWQCARGPCVDDVLALACAHPGCVMLVDTHCKQSATGKRPTLLDWLPLASVVELCSRAREARVQLALAGSLGRAEIQSLLPARPTWFAVRGAVCAGSDRQAEVQRDRVRQLVELIEHES